MKTIQTTCNISRSITIVPNDFIDRHMAGADGEYIKIYLLVLRLTSQGIPVDAERIADTLELTRKDVLRALSYWEKEGILASSPADLPAAGGMDLSVSADQTEPVFLSAVPLTSEQTSPVRQNGPAGQIEPTGQSKPAGQIEPTGQSKPAGQGGHSEPIGQTRPGEQAVHSGSIEQTGPTGTGQVPDKHLHDASELNRRILGTDLEQVIFMAETYIGHPLSVQELNSLCYISDALHFSPDLLEYLVEYCAEKGKKQMRYMEKVAVNWYQQGIDSVRKASDQSALYSQNVFPVMKAFGISGRNPGQSEMNYISSWTSMGFGTDIIIEACNRTLLATHQASFPYANRILEGWKKAGIRSITDIRSLDQAHRTRTKVSAKKTGSSNAFHNFDQRTYDYDDLESRLSQ